jgi:hypothetical protein
MSMQDPFQFTSTPATRAAIWLRFFMCGAGGSGKTYSALAIACALAEMLDLGPVHVIDSESGSALRYAKSPRSGLGFNFIHTPMPRGDYSPKTYEAAMWHVIDQGARVVVVDSISHEWEGANGCLEHVDRIAKAAEERGKKADNFSAWRDVTPMHRRFLETILSLPAHVFCTIRAKTKYESKKDERSGRIKFEKAGEGPIQREGIEYEGDLFGWCADATMTIDKTRCDRIAPSSVFEKPGADFAALLADWIRDAEPAGAQPAQARPEAPAQPKTLRQIVAESAASVDLTQDAINLKECEIRAYMTAGDYSADTQQKALADFAVQVTKRAKDAGKEVEPRAAA